MIRLVAAAALNDSFFLSDTLLSTENRYMIGPKMPRQKEAPIMDFLPEFPRPIYQNRSQNLLGKLKP